MEDRPLGRTDMMVSAISFGAWAIGGAWGTVDDSDSLRALHAAVEAGMNFIDTADVYGDGRSERVVARLRRERPGDRLWVATKAGRRLPKQTAEGYSRENLAAWIDRSLRNLATDSIDLLTGKLRPDSTFEADDHRRFNREGERFDKGETFSGVPYGVGLEAVERLRPMVPAGATLAQLALRWILMCDAVSCAIPGAKTPLQARENAAAAALPPLDDKAMAAVRALYDEKIRGLVHASW